MVGINKAISANDIKNGTSVTGVDGTGNMQSYFDTAKDLTTPALADIQSKYDTRFHDPTYYMHSGLIKDLVLLHPHLLDMFQVTLHILKLRLQFYQKLQEVHFFQVV